MQRNRRNIKNRNVRTNNKLQKRKIIETALEKLKRGGIVEVKQKRFKIMNGKIIDLNSGIIFTKSEFECELGLF